MGSGEDFEVLLARVNESGLKKQRVRGFVVLVKICCSHFDCCCGGGGGGAGLLLFLPCSL